MSKSALYQKYRSTSFDEVVGQETTVRTIRNAIAENKVGHAYLFCGPRGTGKTTMARLLAKAVNCEDPAHAPCGKCNNCELSMNGTHPDIIEMNAANETHVEDIRALIEKASLAPMVGKHKVYIIDEVHQLSSSAASALLKTLEEPPKNVIFILATTDPQKLLATIISRCQRFDFYRINTDQIQQHLLHIAEKENIDMDAKAALKIAELANGGMRDALSIMDQCASFGGDHIHEEDIDKIYGLTSKHEQLSLLNDVFAKDITSILSRTKQYEEHGVDFLRMADDLMDCLKDGIVYSYEHSADLLKVLEEAEARDLCEKSSPQNMMHLMNLILDGKGKFKFAQSQVSAFEILLLNAIVSHETIVQNSDNKAKITTSLPIETKLKPEEKKEKPVIPTVTKPTVAKPIETPTVVKEEIVTLTEDDVLGLMQISNKQMRVEDAEKFEKLEHKVGILAAKYKNILKQAAIVMSGEKHIVFSNIDINTQDRLNASSENKDLYIFMKDELDIDKRPYFIQKDFFEQCINQYRKRNQDGTMPKPYQVELYEVPREQTPTEKVLDLFGEDSVEIIEE